MAVLMILLMFFDVGVGIPVSLPNPGPVPIETTSIEVAVGETQRVALGDGNDSIGHNYYIVEGQDNGIASLETGGTDPEPGCAPGGCGYTIYVDVTGLQPGETEFVVQYCFRTPLESCETTGEAPVAYSVKVTE